MVISELKRLKMIEHRLLEEVIIVILQFHQIEVNSIHIIKLMKVLTESIPGLLLVAKFKIHFQDLNSKVKKIKVLI